MDINILNNEDLEALRALIDNASNVVILSHVNPDGDAMGSSLGLMYYLNKKGKKAVPVVPGQCPDFLQWLPGSEQVVRYDKHPEKGNAAFAAADLICCLDFNDLGRIDNIRACVEASNAKVLLIDHHENPTVKTDLCISQPQLSSTSELLFRLLWQLDEMDEMDKRLATCIYCGMMTDTGGFTYNSNDPAIFFIISQLLTFRIDKDKIYRNVYHNYTESRIRLVGYLLYERLHVLADGKASYYSLSREDMIRFNFRRGDAEGIVNIPLQIKGLRLSISLREDTERDNLIWVSLRSVDDFSCIDVAEKFFNGGGHVNAAGGRLHCSLAEAEEIAGKAISYFQNKM